MDSSGTENRLRAHVEALAGTIGERHLLRPHALAAAADYIDAVGSVVRVATDAPVKYSTGSDALPLVAAHPRRTAKLATQLGVGSSIGRLQKALDSLPG